MSLHERQNRPIVTLRDRLQAEAAGRLSSQVAASTSAALSRHTLSESRMPSLSGRIWPNEGFARQFSENAIGALRMAEFSGQRACSRSRRTTKSPFWPKYAFSPFPLRPGPIPINKSVEANFRSAEGDGIGKGCRWRYSHAA